MSMGLLSFIYRLLKKLRQAGRATADREPRAVGQTKFGGDFFDAASPHYNLQPVRSGINKKRRH
jgi:hypothetical protein